MKNLADGVSVGLAEPVFEKDLIAPIQLVQPVEKRAAPGPPEAHAVHLVGLARAYRTRLRLLLAISKPTPTSETRVQPRSGTSEVRISQPVSVMSTLCSILIPPKSSIRSTRSQSTASA